MTLKLKASVLASVVALSAVAAVIAAPPAQSAAPTTGSLQVPVTGTLNSVTAFTGTLTVTSFKTVNGALYAVGTLTGTGLPAAGVPVTIPVTNASGTCNILNLTLGPLDLNLLGLMVHLDQVHLTITAQSGPGNLLGNLLCDVANLLNSNNSTGLSGLLNRILGQL